MLLFLLHRVQAWPLYRSKVLWGLECMIYCAMIVGFLGRRPPVDGPRGPWESLYPFAVAALPFGMFFFPVRHDVISWKPAYDAAEGLLIAGALLTVVGMLFLRRSFGISVAARELVTRGPYRLVRHPIYLGEMMSIAGVVLIHWCPGAVALAIAFVTLQALRARLEERRIAAVFPAYEAYRRRTGMLLPRIRRGG